MACSSIAEDVQQGLRTGSQGEKGLTAYRLERLATYICDYETWNQSGHCTRCKPIDLASAAVDPSNKCSHLLTRILRIGWMLPISFDGVQCTAIDLHKKNTVAQPKRFRL